MLAISERAAVGLEDGLLVARGYEQTIVITSHGRVEVDPGKPVQGLV